MSAPPRTRQGFKSQANSKSPLKRTHTKELTQIRFGEVPADIPTTLQGLNLEQLEELVDVAVTVNSLNQFIASVLPTPENATEPV